MKSHLKSLQRLQLPQKGQKSVTLFNIEFWRMQGFCDFAISCTLQLVQFSNPNFFHTSHRLISDFTVWFLWQWNRENYWNPVESITQRSIKIDLPTAYFYPLCFIMIFVLWYFYFWVSTHAFMPFCQILRFFLRTLWIEREFLENHKILSFSIMQKHRFRRRSSNQGLCYRLCNRVIPRSVDCGVMRATKFRNIPFARQQCYFQFISLVIKLLIKKQLYEFCKCRKVMSSSLLRRPPLPLLLIDRDCLVHR